MASWLPGGSATPPAEVEVTQVAQMPLPPKAYYPYYTDENIQEGRAPKPPPPPAPNEKHQFQMFGFFLDMLNQTLEYHNRQAKINDMNLVFIHMHHLINGFTPHQARETLRVMMEVQKRQTLETCDSFNLQKAIDLIKEALNNLPEQCDSGCQLLALAAAAVENKEEETHSEPAVSIEDEIIKMMCDIVDSM